jgi:hypothetical protein
VQHLLLLLLLLLLAMISTLYPYYVSVSRI